MAEASGGAGQPWHATWFWRRLTLLGLGLALAALGDVRVLSAGGGAPRRSGFTTSSCSQTLTVMRAPFTAVVGAAVALVTTCAALLNAVRRRHMARPRVEHRER